MSQILTLHNVNVSVGYKSNALTLNAKAKFNQLE